MEAMASSKESTILGSAIAARLRSLARLGHWLETLEATTTPEEITAALRDMLGYERVTLYLKEEAVSPASHPWPPAEASGLVAWVVDQGASLLVSDGRHDARGRNAAGEVVAGSAMAAPLLVGGRLLGVLEVHAAESNTFSESDLLTLEVAARQIAAALESARFRAEHKALLAETRRKLDEMSTLYQVAQEVTGSLQLDEVLETVVQAIRRVLNCRGCCVFLLNPSDRMLEIKAAAGLKPEWRRAARLALGEGIAGRVAASLQPLYVPDVQAYPDYVVFDPEVRCLLAVPLQARGRLIGVLNVDHTQPHAFRPEHEHLLTVAASQVAVAIDNARLYSELLSEKRRQDEFLAIVSHELRTPLTCIQSSVSLLLDDEPPDGETAREFLEIIQRQNERLILMLNNLLNATRLEHADLQPVHQLVALDELISRAVRRLRLLAAEKQITMRTQLPDEPVHIVGDADWLEQTLVNLLDNAIKFTPPEGEVSVAVQVMPQEVEVTVRDTGIGIPESDLERVFDKFYRVPDQLSGAPRPRYGSGLGLYIVRRVVEAHGGHIRAESTPGAGSTFIISLPRGSATLDHATPSAP
jgi:signal transduction histidine kinase